MSKSKRIGLVALVVGLLSSIAVIGVLAYDPDATDPARNDYAFVGTMGTGPRIYDVTDPSGRGTSAATRTPAGRTTSRSAATSWPRPSTASRARTRTRL